MTVREKLKRAIRPIPSTFSSFKTGSLRRRHANIHEIDFDADAVVLTPEDAIDPFAVAPTPEEQPQTQPPQPQLTVESFFDFATPRRPSRPAPEALEPDVSAALDLTTRLLQRLENEMVSLRDEVWTLKQMKSQTDYTHAEEIRELRERVEYLEMSFQDEFARDRQAEGSVMRGRSTSIYSHVSTSNRHLHLNSL